MEDLRGSDDLAQAVLACAGQANVRAIAGVGHAVVQTSKALGVWPVGMDSAESYQAAVILASLLMWA